LASYTIEERLVVDRIGNEVVRTEVLRVGMSRRPALAIEMAGRLYRRQIHVRVLVQVVVK
jgi:hypothetical protein